MGLDREAINSSEGHSRKASAQCDASFKIPNPLTERAQVYLMKIVSFCTGREEMAGCKVFLHMPRERTHTCTHTHTHTHTHVRAEARFEAECSRQKFLTPPLAKLPGGPWTPCGSPGRL